MASEFRFFLLCNLQTVLFLKSQRSLIGKTFAMQMRILQLIQHSTVTRKVFPLFCVTVILGKTCRGIPSRKSNGGVADSKEKNFDGAKHRHLQYMMRIDRFFFSRCCFEIHVSGLEYCGDIPIFLFPMYYCSIFHCPLFLFPIFRQEKVKYRTCLQYLCSVFLFPIFILPLFRLG